MNLNKKTQIVIISHFAFKDEEKGEVFPQNIRNFLKKKIRKLVYIEHPFPSSNFPSSQMTIYDQGVKSYQMTTPKLELPAAFLFVYQSFLTILFIIRKPVRYDLCIACDNLSLLSAFIFRKLGLIKKIIYYTVDYSPKRFPNSILNILYQSLDRTACKISDLNWVTVEEIIKAKVNNGLNLKEAAPFKIIPIGFDKKEIIPKPISKINRFNLVFVGVLYEKQGLQLIIKALPELIKEFPKIRLTVIGSGPFIPQIKRLVKELTVSSYVKFVGYINDHKEVVRLLTGSGMGLATYDPTLGDFTYFADPSKIKLYLLCGLPVITTNVPPIAKKIAEKKVGAVIRYSEDGLISSLKYMYKGDNYSIFRNNAIKLSKTFDNNTILDKAFRKV